MKIDWSEPGVPLSAIAHVAVLVVSLVGFSAARPFADAQESVPVDMISASEFDAMTKGEKTAKRVEPAPKPRVDKVAETEQLKPTQGTDKTDVPTPPARAPEISEATAPPLPPVRPPDPVKPEQKAEAQKPVEKPEPQKAEAEVPKPPEKPQPPKPVKPEPPKEAVEKPKPQLDTAKIAQLIDEKKHEEPPKPPKPPARVKAPDPDFSKTQSDIAKLLVSKEKPQNAGSTGAQLQKVASLGTQSGDAPKLSPSMMGALAGLLREQLKKCFDVPPGVDETKIHLGIVRVVFKEDGSLAERPQIATASNDPSVRAVAEALQRAATRCAPYHIPSQFVPYFDTWKVAIFEPPRFTD